MTVARRRSGSMMVTVVLLPVEDTGEPVSAVPPSVPAPSRM